MQFLYEPLFPDTKRPTRATACSAGYDVFAYISGRNIQGVKDGRIWTRALDHTLHLHAGERAIIPLGFKATMEDGHEAQVRPRSGKSFKTTLRLPNAPGTIDADFPLEWGVIVENTGDQPIAIAHEEAIAQVVFSRFEVAEFVQGTVDQTTERVGGYGSTDRAGRL